LPWLHFSREFIRKIRSEIPELPASRRERLKREYSLNDKEAELFVYYKDLGEYFEKVVSELPPNLPRENLARLTKLSANYLISDLQGLLKGGSVAAKGFLITPENFAEFIDLIHGGKISSRIAKQVLSEMFKTGADPSNVIEEQGLVQITDKAQIEEAVREVIAQNQKALEDYKAGKGTALQYLIGQIMARTKGKANPQMAESLLKEILTKMK